MVHLTEMLPSISGGKRPVEAHYCLEHAIQAGVLAPGTKIAPENKPNVEQPMFKPPTIKLVEQLAQELLEADQQKDAGMTPAETEAAKETVEMGEAITPAAALPGKKNPEAINKFTKVAKALDLVVRAGNTGAGLDVLACPICGTTWAQFKQTGRMGCSEDYLLFETKLNPLVKRTHENFMQHAGKIPPQLRQTPQGRVVVATRLHRELQHALDVENYEAAARVRDQLKKLEAKPS